MEWRIIRAKNRKVGIVSEYVDVESVLVMRVFIRKE